MLLNQQQLDRVMQRHQLDAVIATSPENITYASGFWPMSQWIRRGPQNYVVWPRSDAGEPCVIASTTLLDLAADGDVWVGEFHRYGSFFIEEDEGNTLDDLDRRQAALYALEDEENAYSALCRALEARGLVRGRIALDELGIAPDYYMRIREDFPDVTFVPGFQVFREIRAVKMPVELGRLEAVAKLSDAAVTHALDNARIGMSERDMAILFHTRTIEGGGLPVLNCVGFGTRTAMANVQASGTVLKEGDLIRFDVGGRLDHYRADIARNAVVGAPSEKICTYYSALQKGMERGFELLKPGALPSAVFREVMETVRSEGLPHYRRHHVGHGIGIDGYDLPDLNAATDTPLEAGMVVCLETPYYELGFGGLQIEDMIAITDSGPVSLMTSSQDLRVLSL